jgi:hypothetical protein
LRKWRQRHGSSATYNNLIKVFERAGYNDLVLSVQNLISNAPADADNSIGNVSHTPLPTAHLSPIFSSAQIITTTTGSAVVVQNEDQRGGYNCGIES